MGRPSSTEVRDRLLRWFDRTGRDLPWRRTRDPYHVLVAEYLLQRTRVASGIPYYESFLRSFPTVGSLAEASEEDVLRAWEGLGFYGRARNLHAAAKAIVESHGGLVPSDPEALERLPGVGPYTAGAVASVAFGARVPAVDGNAVRVLARLYRIEDDAASAAAHRRFREVAATLVPKDRPGDFNQALMDLGATVCVPADPACGACPLQDLCVAFRDGLERVLPRSTKPRSPTDVPVVFALIERRGRVLLVRRPTGALLGGLWGLPGGERGALTEDRRALRALVRGQTGLRVRVEGPLSTVARAFSHRRWKGTIFRCVPLEGAALPAEARWVRRRDLTDLPLVPFHRAALESRAVTRRSRGGRDA